MSRRLQKMRMHAGESLRHLEKENAADRIARCKRFLTIENRRLFTAHREGASGLEVAEGRCQMMDTLLHHLFITALKNTSSTSSSEKAPEICLAATGGYGRGELNPFSDVDILFLIPTARGPEMARVNATVEQVLYMLWDLGLKVGHATRTTQECLEQARKDMQSRTSLMESRHLDGSKAVFENFHQSIQKECTQGNVDEFIQNRLKDQAQRHTRQGGTVFVQEPNVKQGCGGLRDLHSLLWITRMKFGVGTLKGLQEKKIMGPIETGRLKRAFDFLMRVRNELHYAQERASDELTLQIQPKIAHALGYHERNILNRIEIFMRDYYRHARDIFLLTESWTERFLSDLPTPQNPIRKIASLFKRDRVEKLDGGMTLRNGMLELQPDSPFPSQPLDLLQVFRTSQIWRGRMGAELQSLVRSHLKLVNREFLYSKRISEIFLSILSARGEVGPILRSMHECGLLDEYIPEFGRLDCLVQHEFYHRYTADEHTLVAIEKLDEVLRATEGSHARYSRLFQQLENPSILYLAILLHDTGKAENTRHHNDASAECARRVSRRLGLNPKDSRTLLFLVDHHTSMSSVAQRRDIDDPSTIEDFKNIVQTREHLELLHLLTYVDGLAVGTQTWSEWRQSLLWHLHENTLKALDAGGGERIDLETTCQKLRADTTPHLPSHISEEEVSAHFTQMPPRYWRRMDPDTLRIHFEILHSFFEQLFETETTGARPTIHWRHFPDRGYSEVTVCTWDRLGLFAKIAGSFTAARINILHADIFTRKDDVALDIFHVCDIEHHAISQKEQMERMEELLSESLIEEKEMHFTDIIKKSYESMRHIPHQQEEQFPTVVTCNTEDSDEYTILEIQTPDRLGLLYQILTVLTRMGFNIALARINTEMGAAMDAFYLTDAHGGKISDAQQLRSLQKELVDTLDRLNQPYRMMST